MGCKGPETYNNCPSLEFNNIGGGVWPIGVGHPCFGCSEEGTGFNKPMFTLSDVKTHTPPNAFPDISDREGNQGVTASAAAVAGAAAGVVVGATAMAMKKLNAKDDSGSEEQDS